MLIERLNAAAGPIAVVMALLAGGCSVYASGLRQDDRPNTSLAFVYGRFEMADVGHTTNVMGFVLACTQGDKYETYNIGFSRQRPVQVFEILPGSCQIDQIIYTEQSFKIAGIKDKPLRALRNRQLSPGVSYYLGDFLAVATAGWQTTSASGTKFLETWGIRDIRSEYSRTTAEMKSAFPRLASLPTEDASMHL